MGSMSFTATRNLGADLTIPLTIPFTVSGTAVFGPDYSCTGADTFSVSSGQLTIPIGSSSATIVVTATPTTVAGLSKSITLTPIAVENKWAIITSSLPWTGTILNLNQASPSLSIINNGTINYSITSDVSSTNPIIINFLRRVTNGSNPAVITSGTVTLPAGATIVNLARVDLSGTSTETVVLQAGSQLSYILSTSTTATINAVTVGVALPTISISLNASAGWVITRTGSTVNSLTVNYSRNVTPISGIQTVNTGVVVIIAGATSINVPITTSSLDRTETLALIAEATYLLGTPTSVSIILTPSITSPNISVSSLVNNTGWTISASPTVSTDTVVNIRQVVTVGFNLPTTTNSTVTILANTSGINVLATTATTARTEALTILTGTGYTIGTPTATLTYTGVLPKATVAVSNDGTGFSINLDLPQLNATTVNLNRTYTHAGIQDLSTAIAVVIPAGSTTVYQSINPVNTDGTTGSVSLAIAAGSSYNTNIGGSNLGILATVPLPNSQLPIVTVSAFTDNSGWKFTLSSVQTTNRTVNYTLSVTPTSGSTTVTYGSMTINAGALTANVLVSNSTGSRVEALTLALGNSYLPTALNYVLQTVSIAIDFIVPPTPTPTVLPYRSSLILNCKFDGANGSTAFVDDYGATIARAGAGNTAISTAQAKFGTGSLYVDGTPLVISDSVGKDKYNFPVEYTIQAWMYVSANTVFDTAGEYLFTRADNVNGGFEYGFSLTSNSLGMYYGIRGSSQRYYTATIPTLNVGWNHIAFTRDVTTVMRFFANGVLGTGTSSTPTDGTALGNPGNQNRVYIGGFFPPYGLAQGLYIDSLEVDNVCLYNAAFTPPVAPTSTPAPAPTPATSGTNLTYVSDGDTNGLVYYLGTNKGTTAWANPYPQLSYSVAATGNVENYPTMTDRTVNPHPNNTWTQNSSYLQVDLGSTNSIILNYVSVRSWINNDRFPRNFKIQGSNDGANFIDLLNVVNNTTIVTNSQWLSLPISGITTAYRYIRYQTSAGGNSTDTTVALGEWEFYGVVPAPTPPAPASTLTGVPSAYSTSLWVAGSSATANTSNQITQVVNSNSNAVTKAVTAPANLSTSLIKLFDPTVNANVLAQNTTNNGYLIVDSKASPIQWLVMVLINDLPNDNTVGQCIFGSSNSYPWHPAAGTLMYSNVGGAEAQNGGQVYINGSSMGIGGTAVIKPPTWTIQYWDMANNTTAAFDYIGGRDRDDQYSISYWQGKFAEIIVGTALLPVADRNKIEGYLAWKYQLNANLPAGHPYKNSAP